MTKESAMYPQHRNLQLEQDSQHQEQQQQGTRSTTPLSFYCTSPWNDQEFQELAMQALTAATSADDQEASRNIISSTTSQSQNRNAATDNTKRGLRFSDRTALNGSPSPGSSSVKKQSVVDVPRDEKPSKKREYEAHTITGTIAPAPTVSRRRKKPKGMPKRPLSAYNIFFQKERVIVLAEAAGTNPSDVDALVASMSEYPEEESGQNGSNASVSFENLGKTIGRRWQSLTPSERRRYELLAQEDGVRYKNEMDAFHEAKRVRNERQAAYQPEELPSSTSTMTGNSGVHDFGGRITVLSGPPEIRALPYNVPVHARFPEQSHPAASLSHYKHSPDWPPQPPAPASALAPSASASSEVSSEYQFPVPPGTERKCCRLRVVVCFIRT